MHRYPLTREQLAQVAVKNHFNGARNPIAQYQQEITLETVLKSTMVAEPLRLFDCSPITDGAAAVIVAPLDRAREFTDTPIRVLATRTGKRYHRPPRPARHLHARRNRCRRAAGV